MRMKKKPLSRRFLMGAKSAFSILLMLAMLITLNVGMGHLPSSLTEWDLTGDNLYDLDAQTRQIVSSLETDVTLTLLAPKDGENEILKRLLSRYAELSDHVTVETLDPSNDTMFLSQYGIDLNTLYTNSVLVAAENDHQLVSYDAIYETQTENGENGETVENATFLGEGALTNAIHAVTTNVHPKVYLLSGHGEKALSSTVLNMLSQENYLVETCSLLTKASVPEDSSCVMIHVPKSDLNESEADLLIGYLSNGGRLVLVTDYFVPGTLPNLEKVCAHMGTEAKQGLIVEGDTSKCLTYGQKGSVSAYPCYLLPTLVSHKITQPLKDSGYAVMLPFAQPIQRWNGDNLTVAPLMSTSGKAYLKESGLNTQNLVKEDGDETGVFTVSILSRLGDGQMLWVPSAQFLNDNVNATVSGGNLNFFMNALGIMCNQEDRVSIREKTVSQETLLVPARVQGTVTVTLIVGLPLLILAAGALTVILRKRR